MQAGWREKVKTEKGNSDEYNFLGSFFFFFHILFFHELGLRMNSNHRNLGVAQTPKTARQT